jgi:hypothetical protein
MFFIFLQNILFFELFLWKISDNFTNNLTNVETMSRNYGIYLHTLKTFTPDTQGKCKCKNIIHTMGKLLHLPHTTLINLKADIEIGLM